MGHTIHITPMLIVIGRNFYVGRDVEGLLADSQVLLTTPYPLGGADVVTWPKP